MIIRTCKWIVFKVIYPLIYFFGSRRKIVPEKIIFVENHGTQLSNDYSLLFEELKNRRYLLQVHFLGMSTLSWGSIVRKTIALLWDLSTASCVFVNESNSALGAFTMRKDTKLIQIWHACGAFKKWGYSVADKSFGDDKKNLEMYSGHRNYHLVPVSGAEVCWAYEEAFGLQGRSDIIRPMGVSRTDVFFSEDKKAQAYESFYKWAEQLEDIQVKKRKVIVYAPTFRGDIRGAKSPDRLDVRLLAQLREEYVVLVKQHPFVQETFCIPEECRGFCVEMKKELSMEELLMVADILVTDYSSVVFEYALMNRPVFFFAYDLEDYYDERGFYYPYEEFVPGPIVRTTEELLHHIRYIEQYDWKRLEQFRDRYMSGCDGHSTERILDYVLNKE